MESQYDSFRKTDLAIADQCRLNVLWFNQCSLGERALEIEVGELRLEHGLRALYREVTCAVWPNGGSADRPEPLPFADASFDLVTSYGLAPSRAHLREMRRLVTAGGTVLLGCPNRWWRGRMRNSRVAAGPRLATDIVAAGFREARMYWVEPSLAVPRDLIPARPGRVRAFEAARARETGHRIARWLIVAAGLHRVLYPALLFVAKA
jgi:SAM-dependent methyltransferase